jgi:hypothetical protein
MPRIMPSQLQMRLLPTPYVGDSNGNKTEITTNSNQSHSPDHKKTDKDDDTEEQDFDADNTDNANNANEVEITNVEENSDLFDVWWFDSEVEKTHEVETNRDVTDKNRPKSISNTAREMSSDNQPNITSNMEEANTNTETECYNNKTKMTPKIQADYKPDSNTITLYALMVVLLPWPPKLFQESLTSARSKIVYDQNW